VQILTTCPRVVLRVEMKERRRQPVMEVCLNWSLGPVWQMITERVRLGPITLPSWHWLIQSTCQGWRRYPTK
jgi:hypothetical protein